MIGILSGGAMFMGKVVLPLGLVACPGLANPCPFGINADIWIGTDVGGGMMTITVSNSAAFGFTNMSLISIVPTYQTNGTIYGLTVFTPFTYGGSVIKQSNPLAVGGSSNGYYEFLWGALPSTVYTLTVQGTMTNGQVVTEVVNLLADGSNSTSA